MFNNHQKSEAHNAETQVRGAWLTDDRVHGRAFDGALVDTLLYQPVSFKTITSAPLVVNNPVVDNVQSAIADDNDSVVDLTVTFTREDWQYTDTAINKQQQKSIITF